MSAPLLTGIVKQVVSGDTIVIRDKPKDRSPNEKTIVLMTIAAPKMGRKKKDGEEKDAPFAWEAREFLRKKLIGKEVFFFTKPFPASSSGSFGSSDRELGKIFFPTKENDITEELVANGFAKIKNEKTTGKGAQDPEVKKLLELQEKAKADSKGMWSKNQEKGIRPMKYVSNDFENFVKKFNSEPVSAIIESVRTNSYLLMLDVLLLPSFHSVQFAISGIKFNEEMEPFRDLAKFFIESRLLQQDEVQVVLEKPMTNCVAGSVLHPKGNIAEFLLKEGVVCCDDRTIRTLVGGAAAAAKLRAAEKYAKEKKLRAWKSYENTAGPKVPKKEFQGIVTEIVNGEALMVKVSNTGEVKKIFLSSIRSPKEAPKKDATEEIIPKDKPRAPRTVFDVPWLFEAREFLRKKLIGKKVNVVVDYVQPARDTLPEKMCCTVTVGTTNIAEALVQNGLATLIPHRDKDDRSSHFDALGVAESKAKANKVGCHSLDPPRHRVSDCTGNRATGLFPMLQKADRIEAIVEYVMSGSRMRLYIPKDSLMITFLLSGISCPRAGTRAPGRLSQPAEPFGEEALNFTKEKVMQREVEIRIESHDKKGCMMGTLTVNNTNLALALVEEGLAEVYSSCSDRTLIQAGKAAKEAKIGLWAHKEEDQKDVNEDDVPERKLDYKDASVMIVSSELHVYAHHLDEKKALDELEEKLRKDFANNPPSCYSKEKPPYKGKLCAAKFSYDNQWYRGKAEKVMGGSSCKAQIFFVDYGNRELVLFEDLAPLPDTYASAKPFAHEYALACVTLPSEYYLNDVAQELIRELENRTLRINVEYYEHNIPYVTIVDAETNEDCIKTCIEKGMFYVQHRREKKLQSLIKEYDEAEAKAKKERLFIWEYGDARADDAKEFGLGK